MKKISNDIVTAAERLLNTEDGKTLMAWLVKEYGLMERSFIPDQHGKVSPINAAIRDGERAVVSLLYKIKESYFFQPNTDNEKTDHKPARQR